MASKRRADQWPPGSGPVVVAAASESTFPRVTCRQCGARQIILPGSPADRQRLAGETYIHPGICAQIETEMDALGNQEADIRQEPF